MNHKTMWIVAVCCVLTSCGIAEAQTTAKAVEQREQPIDFDRVLVWLKRVDGELKKPRYSDLSLEQLKTMTELRLGGHRAADKKHLFVKPEELKHLTCLTELKILHLGENDGVTDDALLYVGKLSGLKELVLWDAPITDAGIKQLVGLKQLTHLDLAFATKLTTESLTQIVQFPNLERLSLAGTKVDDVSMLSKLAKLKELQLGKLMPKGIEELKKAKPELIVK